MDKRVAIIDADSIVYTTAYLNREQADVDVVTSNLDFYLTSMLNKIKATHYAGFLGGSSSNTFRKKIFPSYKSTRPPKPYWLATWEEHIVAHLTTTWRFQTMIDVEADDAVSILAHQLRKEETDYIVCGVDKDLKQIPGDHYNYGKDQHDSIPMHEASYNLFTQVLVGDSTDHIGGCPGIGKVKAKAVLDCGPAYYYTNTVDTFVEKLGIREGLAKFSETYLLVRLLEESDIEININEYNTGNSSLDTLFTR